MSHFKSLLINRVDPRNPQQFGRLLLVLWSLTVFGTLTGFLIQAALGLRVWSEIPGSLLPVFLGASVGYGLMWAGSADYGKRHHPTDEANCSE